MQLLIKNGRILDPANAVDTVTNLYIRDGRIAALGKAPPGFNAEQTIDATNHLVCPGLIDMQARMREPGQTHKADIASESRAAAAAGITTVCLPPDTQPCIDSTAVVDQIHLRSEQAGEIRILPIGALTKGLKGEELAQMKALRQSGCVALSNGHEPIISTLIQRRAMEYAATAGLPIMLQSEDPWLANEGVVHEGMVSTRLGLPGIPECAEVIAVGKDLRLIEQTGVRAHFNQISTSRAVDMIAAARKRGLPISADVAAHQLFLTELDVSAFDARCHVHPPLRSQRDKDGLRAAVGMGLIEVICSDHQPHDADAKLAPFAQTEPGISALETLLPLTLRLVDDDVLELNQAIATLTANPARILGIEAGTLGAGAIADVVIIDPEQYWTLDTATMYSRGRNTPFHKWEFRGRVVHTLVGGKTVFTLN